MSDEKKYHYCDYPTDDEKGKCGKPAIDSIRLNDGTVAHADYLKRCEIHLARLPYWPKDIGGES